MLLTLVIELTNFPYITSYIDYRDQKLINNDNDTFSQDIIRLWSNQTDGKIPTIIVNIAKSESPFTALKLIPIN